MKDSPYKYFANQLRQLSEFAEVGDERTGGLFSKLISEAHASELGNDEKSLLKGVIIATVGTLGLLEGMKPLQSFIDFSNISDEFRQHIRLGSELDNLCEIGKRAPLMLDFSLAPEDSK